MADRYRVEPIELEDGALYHEIQRLSNNEWITEQMYGKPLRFRLERQAEIKLLSLLGR